MHRRTTQHKRAELPIFVNARARRATLSVTGRTRDHDEPPAQLVLSSPTWHRYVLHLKRDLLQYNLDPVNCVLDVRFIKKVMTMMFVFRASMLPYDMCMVPT